MNNSHYVKMLALFSLVLFILVACTKEEYSTYRQFTIDERKGIPMETSAVDQVREPELTPEEKAVQWQKAREQEDEFQQIRRQRENEQRDREEEERLQEEIDFFNSS